MSDLRLWREEFSPAVAEDAYVQRRQFTKFLALTSFGMFAGNLWILAKSIFHKQTQYTAQPVAKVGDIPVGGVKVFQYPTPQDNCILVRLEENRFVAYSQKCTHLSCAVYYSAKNRRLECPCHEGYFSIDDGSVLQGPPPRPLPRVTLDRNGDQLIATGFSDAPL